MELPGRLTRNWNVLLIAGVVISALLSGVAANHTPWAPNSRPALIGVVLVGAVLAGLWAAAALARPGLFTAGLAALAIAGTVAVNPLYQGLGPLVNDPVVQLVTPLTQNAHPRLAVLGPLAVSELASATGADVLSGLTYYPDGSLWRNLDPGQPDWWNNYAKYVWRYNPAATPILLSADKGTMKFLDVDLCAPRLRQLQIQWVVSVTQVTAPCLSLQSTTGDSNHLLFLYRDNNI